MSGREESPQRSGSHSPSQSDSPKAAASAKSSPKASRSRSRSRERSFSRSRSYKRSSYRSRSRSRSRRHYSRSKSRSPHSHRRQRRSSNRDRRRGYYRSHSRSPMSNRRRHVGSREANSRSASPMSNRKRHVGSRDNPKTSRCIGIFGLSLYTQERDLRDVFGRFGPIEEVQVVYDHQTGRSRGFAFIYYRSHEDAHEAKEAAAGTEIDGRRIRVDFSITERAHTPTPGIYLGKPTASGGRERGGRGGYGRRSPSPYVSSSRRGSRYSRSRSRSRSYSPRRY